VRTSYVPPLYGLRAYEMSSATATAVGDKTPPGRNRLPPSPPQSPLNSTSHRVPTQLLLDDGDDDVEVVVEVLCRRG